MNGAWARCLAGGCRLQFNNVTLKGIDNSGIPIDAGPFGSRTIGQMNVAVDKITGGVVVQQVAKTFKAGVRKIFSVV